MSIWFYVGLGIAIDAVIFTVLYIRGKGKEQMTYSEYKEKYGSLSVNFPDDYSNPDDY